MFRIDFDHQPVKNSIDTGRVYDTIADAKSELIKRGYLINEIELFCFEPLRQLEKNLMMDMRFFNKRNGW